MMNKIVILALLLLVSACAEKETEGYLTNAKAMTYFQSIKDICDKDNGKLWGRNLYGPIVFIERSSRRMIANVQDKEGILKEKEGTYQGYLPKEVLITLGTLDFGGTMYAMYPLPSREDEYRIKSMAVKSLYRCFAVSEGIPAYGFNITNMDEKEARLWLKLEWKALRKAINSEGESRKLAVRDALIFRGSNRELYPKSASEANRFETNEGLATFTHIYLCTNSFEEFKTKLMENLDRFYNMSSYSWSFGFITGALYATLLHDNGFDLKTITTDNYDLGETVKNLYGIELPQVCRDVAGSLALSYELDEINAEEEKRLSNIRESIHRQTSVFTEKPVVYVELESPYFDFEQEDVHPLDTLGTLYSSIRIQDNWGKLTVNQDGCLVSSNFKYARITAKGLKADKNKYTGDGWQLLLNNNWEVIKVDENYFVRRLMP